MSTRARPRQSDVARMAGVSSGVVSAVVNGRTNQGPIRVSDETRKRVLEVIRTMGYAPDPVARSLAGGKNRLLGVFTYDQVFPLDQQNFYHPFLVGIEEEAEAQDHNLLLFTRTSGAGRRRSIYGSGTNTLKVADGSVLLGYSDDRAEVGRLLTERYPFVFVGRREVAEGPIPYVGADYASATAEIVQHLFDLGHRRITYFRAADQTESTLDREQGFRNAHARLSLSLPESQRIVVNAGDITPDMVRSALQNGTTAIVAQNSGQARRIAEIGSALGLTIPGEYSLAVLGDALDARDALPGLTTFMIPRREMGAQAVRLLIKIMSDPDGEFVRQVTLACQMSPGSSTASPAARA